MQSKQPLSVLLVSGRDPHGHVWQMTTPILERTLRRTGRFQVETALLSMPQQALEFAPDFSQYDVVVLCVHGHDWQQSTFDAFEKYLRDGGNCVVHHNAVGQFTEWETYRSILGIGTGDSEYGVGLRFDEEKDTIVQVSAGSGCRRNGHGTRHEWTVTVRDEEHPITAELPRRWLHARDELYHGFRGKPEHIENLRVLATAYSSEDSRGTGVHEPVVMTNRLGEGRIVHLTPGHGVPAVSCVGFQTVFVRSVEWAASAAVTLTDVPSSFPTPEQSSTREHRTIVFIGGDDSHGPGAHEHVAGATLLHEWISEMGTANTALFQDSIPGDLAQLDGAAAIVVMWEGWHRHAFNSANPKFADALSRLMRCGTGLVTIHAATAVSDDVEDRFIALTGGNKKEHYSTHPMVQDEKLEIATPDHPVCSGVGPMGFPSEEFYRKIKFDSSGGEITPILRAVPGVGDPDERVVAWTFERTDGARAFSCTGPHFHSSFSQPDFRTVVLNAISWAAHLAPCNG
jgi:type 1 glutamine amidotransferase